MRPVFAAILFCLTASGCLIVQVGVRNPVPGLSTVAVAPFFNLSSERAVDGRRFANAYFTELQKVPGFQVVPVGVVEQALIENRLNLDSPEDVLKLARILGVDAVVVGAVTDYDPYYPPRVGLQVSWFSPQPWTFYPGVPIDPTAHDALDEAWRLEREALWRAGRPAPGLCRSCQGAGETCSDCRAAREHVRPRPPVLRGQSPQRLCGKGDRHAPSCDHAPPNPQGTGASPLVRTASQGEFDDWSALPPEPAPFPSLAPPPEPAVPPAAPPVAGAVFDPRQPLMAYTRLFDGADAGLVAALRDYVELSGDLRSGGWEGYLHRSDDFLRFTAHLMIVEMLTLHGGEAKRRYVFKLRKHR